MAQAVPELALAAMVQVSIPIMVIPDSTLYQVPARTTRGPVRTMEQDTRPRARQLGVLQEDIRDILERGILERGTLERGIPERGILERDIQWEDNLHLRLLSHRLSIIEEDFRIIHRTRTHQITAE